MAVTSYDIIALVCTIMGSFTIVSAFTPQFLSVYKSKNTVALNKPMFTLHLLAGFFFFLSSLCLAVVKGCEDPMNKVNFVRFIILTFLNFYAFSLSTYMIYLKINNENNAKKLSIPEIDYFNNYLKDKNSTN